MKCLQLHRLFGLTTLGMAFFVQSSPITVAGTLDTSFNPLGLTILSDGSSANLGGYAGSLIIDLGGSDEVASADAFQFALQGERIILGGQTNTGPNPSNFALVSLTPTGLLDSLFNPSGLTIQADGSSAKLTGLGYAGLLIIDLGGNDSSQSADVFKFAVQGDRIVIGGATTTGPVGSLFKFAVAVVTSTGLLDDSFNPSGVSITSTGASVDLGGYAGSLIIDLGEMDVARSVDAFNFAMQGDRIILGGQTNIGPFSNFVLVVLTPTGALDSSFNPSGLSITSTGASVDLGGYAGSLIIDLGDFDFASSVNTFKFVTQGDRILFGGSTNVGPVGSVSNFALVVLTATGALDSSFNPSGLTIFSDGASAKVTGVGYAGSLIIDLGGADSARSVDSFQFAIQGDRILLGGETDTGPLGSSENFALVALTPTGILDSSFNPSGLTILSDGSSAKLTGIGYAGLLIIDLGGDDSANSVEAFQFAVQGDRIILGGQSNTGPGGPFNNNFALTVLTPTGVLDSSFNPSGLTILSDGSSAKLAGIGYAGSVIIDLGGNDIANSVKAFQFSGCGDTIILGGRTSTGPGSPASNFALVVLNGTTRFPIPPIPLSPLTNLPFVAMAAA